MKEPALRYPDSEKHMLFTYGSKYSLACVLTQSYEHEIDEIKVKISHPTTYMSGLFCGCQMNWAALTEEVYAIYMSVNK